MNSKKTYQKLLIVVHLCGENYKERDKPNLLKGTWRAKNPFAR